MSIAGRNPFNPAYLVPVLPGMYRLEVESDGSVKLASDCNGNNRTIKREGSLSIAEYADMLRGQPFMALRVADVPSWAGNAFDGVMHKFEEISVGRFFDESGDCCPYFQSPVVSFRDGDKTLTVREDENPIRFDAEWLCWESASYTTVVYVGFESVEQVLGRMFSMPGREWMPHDFDLVLAALWAADMVMLSRNCPAVMTYVERLSGLASDKIGRAELKRAGLLENLSDVNLTLSIWKKRDDLYQKFVSARG